MAHACPRGRPHPPPTTAEPPSSQSRRQQRLSGLGIMLLVALCGGLARRAAGFVVGVPTAAMGTRRSMIGASASSGPLIGLRRRASLLQPLGAAAAAASSGRGKGGSKRKPPKPTSNKQRPVVEGKDGDDDGDDDDDDEEEDEGMTEAELLRLMKDPKGTDAVWANMLRSMKETQGVDLDEEFEEGEEEEGGNGGAVVFFGDDDEEGGHDEEREEGQGAIHIRNSQRSVALDMALLQRQLRAILEIVERADHDVSLWLTNDRSIREYNDRYRGIRRATDILSFPFHEFEAPERPTPESLTLNGRVKDLGDMMVSVAYVQRACERDKEDLAALGENKWWEERGASGAMSRLFDVQARLPYLAIHGVLHLLGYDHETDADYKTMVEQEERVIKAFIERFPEAAPPAPQAVLGGGGGGGARKPAQAAAAAKRGQKKKGEEGK